MFSSHEQSGNVITHLVYMYIKFVGEKKDKYITRKRYKKMRKVTTQWKVAQRKLTDR